jgi:hypothetical protein
VGVEESVGVLRRPARAVHPASSFTRPNFDATASLTPPHVSTHLTFLTPPHTPPRRGEGDQSGGRIGGLGYLALPIHAAHKIVRDGRSAAKPSLRRHPRAGGDPSSVLVSHRTWGGLLGRFEAWMGSRLRGSDVGGRSLGKRE